MSKFYSLSLPVLILVSLFAGQIKAQNDLDKAIAADYVGIEDALKAMAGEMKDEDRRDRMSQFQERCRAVLDKYKPRAAELTIGRFELAKASLHIADPAGAIEHLRSYLSLKPAPASADEAKLLLGDAYRSTSNLSEAVKVYEEFLAVEGAAHEKAPFARLGLATAHFLNLEWERAINLFREITVKDAEHQVAADASVQLIEAYMNSGRFAEARALCDQLLSGEEKAPELERLKAVAEFCGRPAPELAEIVTWVGAKGTSLEALKGRVVVLCFFVNWSVPSARELRYLSELEQELGSAGLTVWGVTKTYKAGKKNWTVDSEAEWLRKFRENPRYVIQQELKITSRQQSENDEIGDVDEQWKELELPINSSFAVSSAFTNHKNYLVRGVPWIILIDKTGTVRFAREGGSPAGGFHRRVVREFVVRLMGE